VLDFEATCDYGPVPEVDVRTAEIIEVPWVVLDTTTGDIIHERQIYVCPDKLDAVTY
jgi:inhibitor of KinA sporulation pathway (predicted exonuclease)